MVALPECLRVATFYGHSSASASLSVAWGGGEQQFFMKTVMAVHGSCIVNSKPL
jgi:hypothetical protein